jgi:hypothetical protein
MADFVLRARTCATETDCVAGHVGLELRLHLTEARLKFDDRQLNPNVGWARHALAIDEHRADFDRVQWGNVDVFRVTAPEEPDWLE